MYGCLSIIVLSATLPASIAYISLALLQMAFRGASLARANLSWPSVPGRIESLEVVEFRGSSHPAGGETYEETRVPRVTFSYAVEGRSFTGTSISAASSIAMDLKSVAGLKCGDPVEVFYDPSNPALSFLVRGAPPAHPILLIVTLLIVLVPASAAGLMLEWELLQRYPLLVSRLVVLLFLPLLRPKGMNRG